MQTLSIVPLCNGRMIGRTIQKIVYLTIVAKILYKTLTIVAKILHKTVSDKHSQQQKNIIMTKPYVCNIESNGVYLKG